MLPACTFLQGVEAGVGEGHQLTLSQSGGPILSAPCTPQVTKHFEHGPVPGTGDRDHQKFTWELKMCGCGAGGRGEPHLDGVRNGFTDAGGKGTLYTQKHMHFLKRQKIAGMEGMRGIRTLIHCCCKFKVAVETSLMIPQKAKQP